MNRKKGIGSLFKKRYYEDDKTICARYMVSTIFGKGITDAKADVVVLSDPTEDLLKYQWNIDANTGQPVFDLDPITNQKIETGFGREIEYLENMVQQGKYQWDNINGVYKYIGN